MEDSENSKHWSTLKYNASSPGSGVQRFFGFGSQRLRISLLDLTNAYDEKLAGLSVESMDLIVDDASHEKLMST